MNLHLLGSKSLSPELNYKILVNNVLETVKRGTDGVSLHVNISIRSEPAILSILGKISREYRD